MPRLQETDDRCQCQAPIKTDEKALSRFVLAERHSAHLLFFLLPMRDTVGWKGQHSGGGGTIFGLKVKVAPRSHSSDWMCVLQIIIRASDLDSCEYRVIYQGR